MKKSHGQKDDVDPLSLLEQDGRICIEQFVTFRVNQLSLLFGRQWMRTFKESSGVSIGQWRMLALLQSGSSTVSQLVRVLEMDKALAGRLARDLQAMSLVDVRQTPTDARGLTLSLTKGGKDLIDKMRPLVLERQRHLLGALSVSERASLYRIIEKLAAAAEEWDLRE